MKDLVPIKVIVKKGFDEKTKQNRAIYPDFNQIDSVIRKGLPWSVFIDHEGISWHYNKINNIGTGEKEGRCVTCVPKDFAYAAVKLFSDEVSILTESEFEDFYDNKAHAHESDEIVDLETLQIIKLKEDLGLKTPEKVNALNPNHPAKGIKKNENKKWKDKKNKLNINIIS